jgi:hypothetical protein
MIFIIVQVLVWESDLEVLTGSDQAGRLTFKSLSFSAVTTL